MMNAKEANARAKEVIKARDEKKIKEIMNYIDTVLDNEIKEVADNGKFSCLVNIPVEFDKEETKKRIENFGYIARNLHANTFEIRWES